MSERLRVAVFASGGGTNFQALLDHAADPAVPWEVVGLITNRAAAGALTRAEAAGLPARVIPTRDRPQADVAQEMLETLESWGAALICLAGYLRLVPAEVVARFRRRILNVHPALLPAFGGPGMYGIHVHRAVLEAGARISGPTVHLVDEVYDRGPILAQWPVPVRLGDTPESLAARVLEAEHRLYPACVDHVARLVAEGSDPAPLPFTGDRFTLH